MSRHAAPLEAYTAEERAARRHAEMLADAKEHLVGLSASWPEPDGRPYDIGVGTDTLPSIVTG